MEFHHPDISLPVVRRWATHELIDLIGSSVEVLATRGSSLNWINLYPNQKGFYEAKERLRKKGLIVEVSDSLYKQPVLKLTPKAKANLSVSIRPERRWNTKWTKRWYMLVYDIPEKERAYRNHIRRFLKSQRMGMLQRSTWITPFDIRPLYHDLCEATALQPFTYLFESRTVLGQRTEQLVDEAWDWEKINKQHADYIKLYNYTVDRVKSAKKCTVDDAGELLRSEMNVYQGVMADDPLLPRALWLDHYLGEEVYTCHQHFQQLMNKILGSSIRI